MRISDWSSDVCSSDLQREGIHQMRVAVRRFRSVLSAVRPMLPEEHHRWTLDELKRLSAALGPARNCDVFAASLLAPVQSALDRKSVVSGKSGSVRVDLGGRRVLKKKKLLYIKV